MQHVAHRKAAAAGSQSQAAAAGASRLQVVAVPLVGRPRQSVAAHSVAAPAPLGVAIPVTMNPNQAVREGDYEAELVQAQANKKDSAQPTIASVLRAADLSKTYDVVVVGAGPAGMYLATELAKRGLSTAIAGVDLPIVNNYGVWLDEYKALGLEHTLECSWSDTLCYFGEGKETRIGRGYGRVSRRKLREHLLKVCKDAGVDFVAGAVEGLQVVGDRMDRTDVQLDGGRTMKSRMVTLAAGAAGGKFLQYEGYAPSVAAQTAYGIEAEVEGYDTTFNPSLMTFMDFRRHHTGLFDGCAPHTQPGMHPNAGDGAWGTGDEVPSFLYAMPLGGNRVFLEETCLVAKPALPFSVLKRRLERRMRAAGIKVKEVHEEEWSYIPTGGPLPLEQQNVTAFGAAANLVHPATGFSVARSFREAPEFADEMAAALRQGLSVPEVSKRVWQRLWPLEKRTQASFHVFGMELLATLDLGEINAFFNTFFALPPKYWKGFLASTLDSTQLLIFAFLTFIIAPVHIKTRLLGHMVEDMSGGYLIRAYLKLWNKEDGSSAEQQ